MFVWNIKPSKKFTVIFAVVSITLGIICIICMTTAHNSVSQTATCDEIGTYSLDAENTVAQVSFLKQFGYTAVADSAESRRVTIPAEFNDAYEEYNNLQKQIGLNLEKFKGKTASEVRFELENSEEKYAVLLIYNEKVIGAHLTNGEYGQSNLPLG